MELFDLSGRVAVITGGNGGIGLGMARGLGQAGATVVVAARNEKKSEAAVAELEALGVKAASVPVNVEDTTSCRKMIEQITAKFNGLDVLVNNAGTNIRREPQDYTIEEWRTVLDTNLTSAMVCSQLSYPWMVKAGGGKIINVGSMMSIFGSPFAAAYGASKGGIVQLSKALATAWAKDNIQVNAILPGWIDTELTKQAREEIKGLHERVLNRTPVGRWGTPDDHAGIAVFLAAAASDFVTGAAITIDGGYSAQV